MLHNKEEPIIFFFKKIGEISLKYNPKPCRTVVFLKISYELLDGVSFGIKTCSIVECHSLNTVVFDRSVTVLFLREHCNTNGVTEHKFTVGLLVCLAHVFWPLSVRHRYC